jgi:hypothetical protein
MQRGERQSVREGSQVKVTDLRSQFRATAKPAKPEKAAKHSKSQSYRNRPDLEHQPKQRKWRRQEEPKDLREEQMAKAEKLSHIQHTTSLLKSKPKNNRLKDHKEKKPSGLLFQLVLVGCIVAGAAVAYDPTLLPSEVRNIDWREIRYSVDVWLQDVTGR